MAWEQRLTAIWQGQPLDLFDLALADTVRAYPGLSRQPFQDMILGMVCVCMSCHCILLGSVMVCVYVCV